MTPRVAMVKHGADMAISTAIAQRRQGWVTNEDKLEAIMEGRGKQLAVVDWGPQY